MKLFDVIITVWIDYNYETKVYEIALGVDGVNVELDPSIKSDFFYYIHDKCDVKSLMDVLSIWPPESHYYLVVLKIIKNKMREYLEEGYSEFPFYEIYYDIELELVNRDDD